MMEFPVQLNHVKIIAARNFNDQTIIKSLMSLHKDLQTNQKLAAKAYVAHGIIESLLNLCRCSNNLLITILSINLLYAICQASNEYLKMFVNGKGITLLTVMISPRDNSELGEEMMNRTLLLHESAAKFLVMISASDLKYQQFTSDTVLLEKIVELSTIYLVGSSHLNCCFKKIRFTEHAKLFLKETIEGRKLVGKICTEQSGGSSVQGGLNVLALDLYDTTTDEDVNINKKLIDEGYAWPDISESDTENVKTSQYVEDEMWLDIYVTKVNDAHCFWSLIDKNAISIIEKLSSLLEDYIHNALSEWNVDSVKRGMKVIFPIQTKGGGPTKWRRGCVVNYDEVEQSAVVLLVDFGYTIKININQLAPLPLFAKDIPHQACLCVLKGIQAAPKNTKILKYAIGVMGNIATFGHPVRMQIHQMGATKHLFQIAKLGNKELAQCAMKALSNIALNHNIRWQIGTMGGCKILMDLLKDNDKDDKALKSFLPCLLNFVVENSTNRKHVANQNGLLILMKIYRSSLTSYSNKEVALTIMKNLIGDGWRLLDPANIPDVRGIIEENIDTYKGSFNLPNLCGDELLEEVKKRRTSRIKFRNRDCEAEPQPTYASITVDDVVKKLQCSSDGYDTKSDGYDTKSDGYDTRSDGNDNIKSDDNDVGILDIQKRQHKSRRFKDYDGYIYKTSIGFQPDQMNAFMYGHSIRNIKAVDVGNIVCGMLNANVGGLIYLGVSENTSIVGVNITRRERDNLRLGIDDLMERFKPRVNHDKYEIKFRPVMHGTSIETLEQLEERYIIEIHVARNIDKLYQTPSKKMFCREGRKNIEMSVQKIREMAIKEQEMKYQAEIRALQLTLQEARRGLSDNAR